ncbi:bacteriocin-type signal sequence [Paenibacillus aurantius]|uniref:Bacteriocin-type signal sequence n=1 Tax=Paenibacillus aurantius TaxID=2918900 RepID=A0AA96LEI0_9BACL|nr:bacteriocin-type signal sequence [Paenibacillus aurantius]WNQ10606.1 bacteriocin-type signal sequence [Paenibacillus aurantius]
MKKTKTTHSFKQLNEAEMMDVNGGDWRDIARWSADFVRGLFSSPFGCGLGDVTGRNSKPSSGCSPYPASKRC